MIERGLRKPGKTKGGLAAAMAFARAPCPKFWPTPV